MRAISLYEIRSFFGTITGYLVMMVFLVINGLLLWAIEGDYNIAQSGYADLSAFFLLAPWVLIFLIPAVCMRSFSVEIQQGTIELLLTKPLSISSIVAGKYFGALFIVVLAILPTLVYVWVLDEYLAANNALDWASIAGSYIGLVFLAGAYCAMGIFSSSLSSNQVVAFIVAVFLCVFFSLGIDIIAQSTGSLIIEQIGVNYHFRSISKGVIDTRDLVYFVSLIVLFLSLTQFKIKTLRK